MDLKIKDVAELLNVSETTIRRWLSDGKIPAYRINHQYRFSRTEIEAWVMHQESNSHHGEMPFESSLEATDVTPPSGATRSGGNRQFSLYRAINVGGIYRRLLGDTKAEILASAATLLAKTLGLDAEVLADLLIDREKLMPTALNNGIAIPHARDFLLPSHQDVVAVAFPEKPINYGALDGKPVHTLFFLFASEDTNHLHLLAKIAHFSSQKKAHRLLQTHPTKKELLSYVKTWESQIYQVEN